MEDEEDPEGFSPKPVGDAYRIYNLIPESENKDDYNYKKLKEQALREKYVNMNIFDDTIICNDAALIRKPF